jgi:hypothetical protein
MFVLGEIGPPAVAAVEPLCKQLLAAWRNKRRWNSAAATALVLIGDERAVPVLATAANEENPWDAALNEWLQVYFDDRGREARGAVPVLLGMLNAPVFKNNRIWILAWIRWFHSPGGPISRDLSGLQRCLHDSDQKICRLAALAAGWLGMEARSLLSDVLEAQAAGRLSKPDYPFDEIVSGLQGNAAPLAEWIKSDEKGYSRPGWRDHHQWRGWAPEEGTGTFTSVVPHLLRVVLLGSEDDQARALHSMATIGPDAAPAVPLLLELLRRATTAARCDDLVNVLGAIGPQANEAVPAIAELLLERQPVGDWESAKHALKTLKRIGSPQAVAALIQALDKPDLYGQRYWIVGALGGLGEKAAAALPKLKELSRLPDDGRGELEAIAKAIERIDRSRDE